MEPQDKNTKGNKNNNQTPPVTVSPQKEEKETVTIPVKPWRRYQLLAGTHEDYAKNGEKIRYVKGDVFESSSDLLSFNGPNGYEPKFALITNDQLSYAAPSKPRIVDLGAMSTEQLVAFAHENEIDTIKTGMTKEELLSAIRGAIA